MRPGQAGEIEIDLLRILDLGRRDRDVYGRRDGMRRSHRERLNYRTRMRGLRLEYQRRRSGLPDGYEELVLHGVDPEGGIHLGRVGVGVGRLSVADEKGDIGGSAANFGTGRSRRDGEDGRAGDVLADVVIA